jgi:hypothetical protein
MLMHSQDRNHFNRIFGGHLMRLAFELAYATAAQHSGVRLTTWLLTSPDHLSFLNVSCLVYDLKTAQLLKPNLKEIVGIQVLPIAQCSQQSSPGSSLMIGFHGAVKSVHMVPR